MKNPIMRKYIKHQLKVKLEWNMLENMRHSFQ